MPVQVLPRLAAGLVLAGVLTACGDSGERAVQAPTSHPGPTTAETAPAGPVRCLAEERGYELEFPESWFANDAGVAEPCRFFHPEPFTLVPGTEAPGLAISVRLNPVSFDQVVPPPEGSSAAEMVERRTTTIDGRSAVRAETVATGQALLPRGTRAVTWFVDASDGTLVATTSEAASAGRYEDNVEVLDGMMQSLHVLERESSCSARRLAPGPTPQPEIPEAVSAMRMRIIEAARACDYEKLAELALAGDSAFTYSFGGEGRPAAFWREAEAHGRPVLRSLVEILDGPFATRSVDGTTQYLWPSAYGVERLENVPPAAREELRRIYGEEELRRFERFGSYVGDRVGITGSGDWTFFVGGD